MIYNTYVQQLSFDGLTYTKGSVVDLLKSFNIISQDFPFVKHPEPKELPSRDWYGEDGLDVYVPDQLPIKNYEIEVVFLYTRNLSMNSGEEDIAGESPVEKRDRLMRRDISNFLDFLYGRSKGSVNDTVQSGRLAIYNEYTGIGRKDVVVSGVDNELFEAGDGDPDCVAKFTVKFMVYDPTTDVTAVKGVYDGEERVTDLNFSVSESQAGE